MVIQLNLVRNINTILDILSEEMAGGSGAAPGAAPPAGDSDASDDDEPPPLARSFSPAPGTFSGKHRLLKLRLAPLRTVQHDLELRIGIQAGSDVSDHIVPASPPGSPVEEAPRHTGPVTSTVTAQMKCKVFLKQQHAQWKSLGSAKLRLYREDPTNIKQLVVEADDKHKTVLISTIVLTDGVERVGKTGVAIELSDKGMRTGVVYMLQLRNEKSAGGLFDELLAGSDRANGR